MPMAGDFCCLRGSLLALLVSVLYAILACLRLCVCQERAAAASVPTRSQKCQQLPFFFFSTTFSGFFDDISPAWKCRYICVEEPFYSFFFFLFFSSLLLRVTGGQKTRAQEKGSDRLTFFLGPYAKLFFLSFLPFSSAGLEKRGTLKGGARNRGSLTSICDKIL